MTKHSWRWHDGVSALNGTIAGLVRQVLDRPGDEVLRLVLADAVEELSAAEAIEVAASLRGPGHWTLFASLAVALQPRKTKQVGHWLHGN